MSNAIDLKARSRKTITSSTTGTPYTIRKLTRTELTEAGLSVILPVDTPKGTTESVLALARQGEQVTIAQTRYALEKGVVSPRIVYGDESSVPEGDVHASWIAEDERFLFLSVMEFSGIASEQAIKELQAYTKNAPGSESLTTSAAGTGDSLMNSSATTSDPEK